MKKPLAAILALLAWMGSMSPASAQYTDTIQGINKTVVADSIPKPVINWASASKKRVFPYKQYLVPASLVVYGVASLHTDFLKSVNEKVKEEVYTERQPSKMHIDNYLRYAPAVAVYALNAAGVHGKNNFRDRTMIMGISALLTGASTMGVKKIAGEMRPDGGDRMSFFSGHTSCAFAAAEFLRQEYKDVSPLYGVAGYAAAAATGFLRIQNNRHWMGDVVAGAGVGIISTKLAYWVYPAIKQKLFKDRPVSTVVMPTYQDGAFGLGLVHQF